MTSFSKGILIYPLCLIFSFPLENGWITVVRGKWKVVLRSLENVENEFKNIIQNFASLW